jgi:multiple antibiotic resistance protein
VFEHRLFTDFVTLFVVINPINLIPYFVLFTRHQPPKERQRTALRSVVIAAAILVVFIVLGQILLEALASTSRRSASRAAWFCSPSP